MKAKDGKPLFTAKAWDCIGFDEGKFRVVGGCVFWEAVMYNDATARSNNVKLARLKYGRELNRYVAPDTLLEFFEVDDYSLSLPPLADLPQVKALTTP